MHYIIQAYYTIHTIVYNTNHAVTCSECIYLFILIFVLAIPLTYILLELASLEESADSRLQLFSVI